MKKKTTIIGVSGALALFVIIVGLLIYLNHKPPDPNVINGEHIGQPRKSETDVIVLGFAAGLSLELLPVPGCAGTYSTRTPITNAQYHVAVKDKAVPPPVLPNELASKGWEKELWKDGHYLKGHESYAVLFVNLDEAGGYCRWLEKEFPDYRFRVPSHREENQIETKNSRRHSESLQSADDARPASHSGEQMLSKGRFWHAPRTIELADDPEGNKALLDSKPDREDIKIFLDLLPGPEEQTRRFRTIPGGGLRDFKYPILPNSFRVVAIVKDAQKAK